jgi:hypothetical protein
MGLITTSISGLVVPDGNDPISNGDDLLRALAQRTGNGGTAAAILKTSLPAAFVTKMVAAGFNVDATHIAIPDWRGRMPVMRGTHGDVDSFTDNEGIVVGSRRPAHKHSVSEPAAGSHSHGVHSGSANNTGVTDNWPGLPVIPNSRDAELFAQFDTSFPTDPAGNHTHGTTVGPQTASPTDSPAFAVANAFVFAGPLA